MIPLHVFEENTAPGGFFFMNNSGFKYGKAKSTKYAFKSAGYFDKYEPADPEVRAAK